MAVTILIGDVRERLKELPSAYFDCVVTSPPYYGLRDNGVVGQIGLERCLGEHLDVMVEIFREVRRVLKSRGTVWVNYGDCYATTPNGKRAVDYKAEGNDDRTHRDKPFSTIGPIYQPDHATARGAFIAADRQARNDHGGRVVAGGMLKNKDLCMVANRLAIALQDDGWYVRSEIVWAKPNPMPESIYDRPAVAHEKIWLLSKGEDYYYNADAIREPVSGNTHRRVSTKIKVPGGWDVGPGAHGTIHREGITRATYANMTPGVTPKSAPENSNVRAKASWRASTTGMVEDRNARNVWTIPSAPFDGEFCLACRAYFTGASKRALRVEVIEGDGRKERRRFCTCGRHDQWLSHFSTFPPALAERCIKAGVPPTTCHLCGEARAAAECGGICVGLPRDPGRVLDIFGGAGTVGLVAQRLGVDATLIEINPAYAEMQRKRIDADLLPKEKRKKSPARRRDNPQTVVKGLAALTQRPVGDPIEALE